MSTILDVLTFPEQMPGYDIKAQTMETVALIGMPTLTQAKKILWKPTLKILEDCPLVENINRSEHIIQFQGNRPDLHLVGLNDNEGDRARGLKIWRAALDEIQDIKRDSVEMVVLPAMADTPKSRGLFTGTPKGKQNYLYELFQRAPKLKQWRSFNFPTWTNPYIPKEIIEEARLTLSPRLFAQEFEASFVNFEGQIFGEFDPDHHVVSSVPWERCISAYIGVDPGDINPALVLVALCEDFNGRRAFYLADVFQPGDGSNAVPENILIEKVKEWCRRHRVLYRCYVDPSRPGVVLDIRSAAKHKAMKRAVKGYNSIEEGLQLTNNLFFSNALFISRSVGQRYIDGLQSYHRKKNKDGIITEKVEDGQDDHFIDALRYVLASLWNQENARRGDDLPMFSTAWMQIQSP